MFIEQLCAKHCIFYLHLILTVTLCCFYYFSLEKLSPRVGKNLSKVMQLVSGRAENWIQNH